MVYVVMMENGNHFDSGIGRGEIIGAFNELDTAIENVRKLYGDYEEGVCIYKLNMDQLYVDINDIFHCVWKK
jgi:hypothetical protein